MTTGRNVWYSIVCTCDLCSGSTVTVGGNGNPEAASITIVDVVAGKVRAPLFIILFAAACNVLYSCPDS